MCGPLSLALAGARRNAFPAWPWLHHGGRITTYSVLGAASGALGAAIVWAGFERWLSIGAGAAALILALGQFRGSNGVGAHVAFNLKNHFAQLLKGSSAWSTVGLGALNGLLPCGLVYLACAAAASSGSVAGGIVIMWAFGLGTLPMLFGIHFASRSFGWANPARWRRTILICSMIAGGLLILRGMALGVPYVSPSISNGKVASCCHKSIW